MSLDRPRIDHSHAEKLAKMSHILDDHRGMAGLIEQDLVQAGSIRSGVPEE